MSYGTTTSVFHLAMWHTVPQPVYFTWQCAMRYHDQCISPGNVLMRYHDQCNLAICLTVSQPVYFTWQCVIRYHNQCISPDMCHTVPQPVYFSWQCVMRYHNQCISPANVLCGTTNEEIITNFMTTLIMKMNL